MPDFQFRSASSAFSRGLRNALHQQEVARQQAFWNELEVSSRMAAMARAENEQRRQASLDAMAAEDRQRRIANEDRAYTDSQARQAVLDQRYEAEQQQKAIEREDAQAQRYLDSERRLYEQKLADEAQARENAANRANARYIVDKQMAPKPNAPADAHNPAAITIDALDELSAKINTAEGLTARAGGVWGSTMARANYDDDVSEYSALVDGAVPLIARKMGHTGVLTQADVDSVKAMFPKPGDSRTLRDRKIARLRSLMNMPTASGGNAGRSKYQVTVR
jgi:hypothetical protein